jgi:cytochrome c oxidase assembly protein subunit 15
MMGSMNRIIKTLGVVASVGMLIVLMAGATVTNTGSEHGCGKSWPLCHGKLIPQFAVTTLIEFIHRVDAAVETVLILALAAGALYLYRQRIEIRLLSILMVAFLFLQAGLGAWAVMQPQNAAALALHFGVSLTAFASVVLTTVFLFEAEGSEVVRDRPIPRAYQRYVWGLAAYAYVVVYSGAYVRHTKADDACTGWPLCNGSVIPDLQGKVASAFGHRIGAAVLTLGIVGLVIWSRRLLPARPDLSRASHIALGFVVLQALAGAVVVWTDVDLFAALAHASFVALMFAGLCYLCVHVLPRPATSEERSTRTHAMPAPDTASAAR